MKAEDVRLNTPVRVRERSDGRTTSPSHGGVIAQAHGEPLVTKDEKVFVRSRGRTEFVRLEDVEPA